MIERLHALSLGELESLSSAAEAGHLCPPATEAQLLAEHLSSAIPLLDLFREFPSLFYDPRTLERTVPKYGSRWFPEYSMHAKCIVVDRRRVLVGSADFTARGQTDNLEVGIALDDPSFATALLHQWNAATAQAMVREVVRAS